MKSLGYVHTPITEHHRWEPVSRRSISTGKGTFNRTTRLMLHQMRWRKPPRQIGLGIVAWVTSLLVHLVMLVAMLLVRPPQPYTPTPQGQENAIQVRFIEAAPRPPPPPVPMQPRRKKPGKTTRNVVSTAPHQAPVARPARARPKAEAHIAANPVQAPSVKHPVVSAHLPQAKPVPQAPPAPKAPAIVLPPPEKLVMEHSRMALPPPKVDIEAQAPVHAAPSPLDQPIEVTPARPDVGVPNIRISVDTAAPVATANVAPVQPAPAPRIDVGTARPRQQIRAQANEPVRVGTTPQLQDIRVPEPSLPPVAEAPTLAPQVDIHPSGSLEQVPDVRNETPLQPQVRMVQVPPAPASVPPVARPATLPDTSSWARSHDDHFSTSASPPGHGTAARQQAGRGSPEGVPEFIQRMPQGNSDVMTRHYKGLTYKPTIFDQYWAPDNQDVLTQWLQKLVDITSYHGTLDMGHGLRIHCGGWLLGFGCGGDPPDPPSAKSNDPRLNMAPAKPLAPGLGASSSAPAPVRMPESSAQSVECETAKISGGPPPPDCGAPAPTSTQPVNPWNH